MKIKAVLFDLGNTIVKSFAPEVTFQEVLESLGINRTVEQAKEALKKTDEEFRALNYNLLYGKIPYRDFWNKWDALVLKHLGLDESQKLASDVQEKWFDCAKCQLYPDVDQTLYRLKSMGLKIGLVSGGYEEDVYAILERTTLPSKRFDAIVGANTVKETKPHPTIFKYALRRLGAKPEEALFVGDNVDADYQGAEQVGIKAILIQRMRDGMHKTANLRTIKSLDEIFQYIS